MRVDAKKKRVMKRSHEIGYFDFIYFNSLFKLVSSFHYDARRSDG